MNLRYHWNVGLWIFITYLSMDVVSTISGDFGTKCNTKQYQGIYLKLMLRHCRANLSPYQFVRNQHYWNIWDLPVITRGGRVGEKVRLRKNNDQEKLLFFYSCWKTLPHVPHLVRFVKDTWGKTKHIENLLVFKSCFLIVPGGMLYPSWRSKSGKRFCCGPNWGGIPGGWLPFCPGNIPGGCWGGAGCCCCCCCGPPWKPPIRGWAMENLWRFSWVVTKSLFQAD